MLTRSGLKPGKPLARKSPMKRGGTKKAAPAPKAAMKASRPKMTAIRKAARDEECTLRIPGVCNFDPATTVLCHSNRLSDGKGMGLKAPDTAACFGCSACHSVLDRAKPRPDWMTYEMLQTAFDAAVVRTHAVLRKKGIIGDEKF